MFIKISLEYGNWPKNIVSGLPKRAKDFEIPSEIYLLILIYLFYLIVQPYSHLLAMNVFMKYFYNYNLEKVIKTLLLDKS